jgi:hypothetical protein
MKYAIVLVAVLLSGCAGFKLGSMVYCASATACSFQAVPATPPAPAQAASGTSV